MTTTALNWKLSKADSAHVESIMRRLESVGIKTDGALRMDVTACHLNGCPLDLAALAEAPLDDFFHDLAGIARHLDRSTGQLGDCFLPRYAATPAATS